MEPAKLVLTSFLNAGVFFCSVYMYQFILVVFVLSVSDAGPDGRNGAQLLLRGDNILLCFKSESSRPHLE